MNAEIVAGRLASVRSIHLRQELGTIAQQIQAKHKDRLPMLDLVSTAAYEQVFNRQVLNRMHGLCSLFAILNMSSSAINASRRDPTRRR